MYSVHNELFRKKQTTILFLLVSGKISAKKIRYDLGEGRQSKVPQRNYRKLFFFLFVLLS